MNTSITFLLPTKVNNVDLATASVFLSYIRSDGEPDMVLLERDSANYNENYYQYVLPITCKLSRYPGQVCMWLQICDGNSNDPIIAKSGECFIRIHESKNMDDYLCDHQLTALYQMKKQMDSIVDNPPDSGDDNPDGGCDSDEFDGYEVVEF